MTRWDSDNLNSAHTERELQQEWGSNVELNLSGWIVRRKRDVGPYADHIIKGVTEYERRIEQLERELSQRLEENGRAETAYCELEIQLSAEKALADQAANLIKGEAVGVEWKRECTAFLVAHSKARGL